MSAAVLCRRIVERQGPDPERTAVRPHQQRRQPRRGRQGILLLPRQHADPLVHEVSIQVSAARISVWRSRRRRTPRGRATIRSTNCSTPASSTGTATSTSSSSTRRRIPEDILIRHHASSTAGQTPARAASSCRRCGFATRGRGKPASPSRGSSAIARRRAAPRRRCGRMHERSGAYVLHCDGRSRRCSSPKTRPTSNGSSARRTRAPLRQGRHRRVRRAREGGRGQSRTQPERRSPRTTASSSPPARRRACACGCATRRSARPVRRASSTESFASAPARGRRVLSTRSRQPASASEARARCSGRPWPGCCGASSTINYDVDEWLEEHGADPLPPPGPRRGAQPRVGPPARVRRDLDAGQVGVPVVRGVGPGVSRRRRWRSSTSTFAKQQLDLLLDAEWYMHPNGQLPAYEWNFGDVNPPVHAWAAILRLPDRAGAARRRRPRFPRSASFSKLLLNFTWWVNRKDRYGKNVCSKAASSGSTTSASSTAARRCRRAGIWSRPTARLDGALLPEHARDRARARRRTTRPTRTSRRSSSMHFLLIAHAMNGIGADGHVGRGGRLLLRRPAPARRHRRRGSRSARWSVCCRSCAATAVEKWQRERLPRLTAQMAERTAADAGAARIDPSDRARAHRRRRARSARARQPRPAAPDSDPHARRKRVLESATGSARCSRSTPNIHTSLRSSGREYRVGYVPAEVGQRHVRRQLELARTGVDAGQRPDHRRLDALLMPTTATTSRSSARPAPAI